MLQEYASIFYIDSSVRFLAGLDVLLDEVQRSPDDIMTFVEDNCSIFSVTHQFMFNFLPISRALAVNSSVQAAGIVYLRRTQQVSIPRGIFSLSLRNSGPRHLVTWHGLSRSLDRVSLHKWLYGWQRPKNSLCVVSLLSSYQPLRSNLIINEPEKRELDYTAIPIEFFLRSMFS
jgi:hypothetical protein